MAGLKFNLETVHPTCLVPMTAGTILKEEVMTVNQAQLDNWEIVKKTLSEKQMNVYLSFKEWSEWTNEGLTTPEVAYNLKIPMYQASPRISELCQKGILHDTGKQRNCRNSKQKYTIWNICEVITPPEKTVVLRVTENELGLIIQSLPFRVADDLGNKIRKAYEKFGGKL